MPSDMERERHALTHVPLREWCHYCVVARSRSTPHRRIALQKASAEDPDQGRPKFQADYMFMRLVSEVKTAPCLTLVERGGCVIAARLQTKSAQDLMAKGFVVIMEALGFTGSVAIQYDKENSLKDMVRKIAAKRGAGTVLRFAPRASKGSQGLVEAMHAQLHGAHSLLCDADPVRDRSGD